MGGITINGKPYVTEADKGSNTVWDTADLTRAQGPNDIPANYDILSLSSLATLMNLADFNAGTDWPLETLLEHAGDVVPVFSDDPDKIAKEIDDATKKLETFNATYDELSDKLKIVEQQLKSKGPGGQELTQAEVKALNDQKVLLESALAETEKVLEALVSKLQAAVEAEEDNDLIKNGKYKEGNQTKELDAQRLTAIRKQLDTLKQRLGAVGAKFQDALDAKAAAKPGAKAAAGGGSSAGNTNGTGGASGGGSRAAVGNGPFGQARGAFGPGFPPLDMNALLMSNYMQQNQLESLDAMHKSESESKRMMLLFFMLARMAMSGDIGAMYQFLRFIGHIVNKDKAMQNVQLARKLIELQDVSRKLTQMLVDTPVPDEEGQGVQAEYMKLQQKVQAEQGVIATSQKLIAQMLEEFTQVSEMMTGMVKSLLDARGRELSMLAVWRA